MMGQSYLFPSLKIKPFGSKFSRSCTIAFFYTYQLFIYYIVCLCVKSCDVWYEFVITIWLWLVFDCGFWVLETKSTSSHLVIVFGWWRPLKPNILDIDCLMHFHNFWLLAILNCFVLSFSWGRINEYSSSFFAGITGSDIFRDRFT